MQSLFVFYSPFDFIYALRGDVKGGHDARPY